MTAPCPEARTITCEHPAEEQQRLLWEWTACVFVHKRYFCRFVFFTSVSIMYSRLGC